MASEGKISKKNYPTTSLTMVHLPHGLMNIFLRLYEYIQCIFLC